MHVCEMRAGEEAGLWGAAEQLEFFLFFAVGRSRRSVSGQIVFIRLLKASGTGINLNFRAAGDVWLPREIS